MRFFVRTCGGLNNKHTAACNTVPNTTALRITFTIYAVRHTQAGPLIQYSRLSRALKLVGVIRASRKVICVAVVCRNSIPSSLASDQETVITLIRSTWQELTGVVRVQIYIYIEREKS